MSTSVPAWPQTGDCLVPVGGRGFFPPVRPPGDKGVLDAALPAGQGVDVDVSETSEFKALAERLRVAELRDTATQVRVELGVAAFGSGQWKDDGPAHSVPL